MLMKWQADSDKAPFTQNVRFPFLFPYENIYPDYKLEAPHQDASNLYPQHICLWKNKKNRFVEHSGAMIEVSCYSVYFTQACLPNYFG